MLIYSYYIAALLLRRGLVCWFDSNIVHAHFFF